MAENYLNRKDLVANSETQPSIPLSIELECHSETTSYKDANAVRYFKDISKTSSTRTWKEIGKCKEVETTDCVVSDLHVQPTDTKMNSKHYADGTVTTKSSLEFNCNRCKINCSPMFDEGCATNVSPYSSSSEDDATQDKTAFKSNRHRDSISRDKVARSSSSDSALGLEEDVQQLEQALNASSGRRMTLTVSDIPLRAALLPLAAPTSLPETPSAVTPTDTSAAAATIPSKIILEANIIEIPTYSSMHCAEDSGNEHGSISSDLRRVSSQSDFDQRIRYVRTPSVVVSDYSDDVYGGITLEEIEFLRRQRLRRTSLQDVDHYDSVSAASSCSNLNFIGSTISGLDTIDDNIIVNQVSGLQTPERKISDCSSCSTGSGDEESLSEQLKNCLQKEKKKPSGWRKLRNIVQWTPFFQTYKKQRYPWVQLAGHQGNFKAGPDPGTVLKKLCPKEEKCFHVLMKDVLRAYVPEYKGQVTSDDGELYLQLQDLLSDFNQPCVMDCKIGVRTYLEEELSKAKEKPKLRKDMYEKMIQIDPNAPSEDENKAKGVTKPRYMVWRETISSTATLGFRIEGIKKGDGTSSKDFKTTKTKEQILESFKDFTHGFPHAVTKYIHRLKAIRATLDCSNFFLTHEVIGSSLLFVHDKKQASIWLIDFAKTVILPTETNIDHNSKWSVGNHEDGYLIGINNLIEIFEELQTQNYCQNKEIYENKDLNLTALSSNQCNDSSSNANNPSTGVPNTLTIDGNYEHEQMSNISEITKKISLN